MRGGVLSVKLNGYHASNMHENQKDTMTSKSTFLPLPVLLTMLLSACGGGTPPPGAEVELSYTEIVDRSEHVDGLLEFYRDRETGERELAREP